MSMEELLAHCRKMIETQLGWGDSEQWTGEDFELLSDKIFDKTQVRLSVTTLKRIWGKVKYDSSPNVATLNALSQFVGYESWRELRQKALASDCQVTADTETPMPGTDRQLQTPKTRKKKSKVLLIAPAVIAVLVAGTFLIAGRKTDETETPVKKDSKVFPPPLFESKKTSDDLPNSVIFHYDASQYDSDSVYIQQNWDPTRREKVDPRGNYHTSIYYYPGYFGARLIVDGEAKAFSTVFIKSQGWKAMIDQAPVPAYLSAEETMKNGVMGVSSAIFRDKLNTNVFNETWATFHNVREFEGVTGADFYIETTLRNTATVEESVCRKVIVYVLGTQSAVIVPLSDKGCVSALQLLVGNRWVDGKTDDLSRFGCDFSKPQKLGIRVADGRLEVMLNAETVFTAEDTGSIGDVIGIRYAFEGPGEVGEVRLGTAANNILYEDLF